MFVTIAVGAVLVLVYIFKYNKNKRYRMLIDQIPGPKALPIVGNAHQLKAGHEFYLQVEQMVRDYGSNGIFRVWIANRATVMIHSPQYIETLINSMKHIDKSRFYTLLHPWLGTGLLTSTGEKWQERRKLLTPTFHFNILGDFLHVFNKQSQILVNKWKGKAANGPFNIYPDITLCTLDVICETAMGKDIGAQTQESDYAKAVYRVSSLTNQRMRKPWFWSNLLYCLFGPGNEYNANLKTVHDFTRSVIADRLADFDQKKAELAKQGLSGETTDTGHSKKRRLAFLDMLLYISDNLTALSLGDIKEEVDTFMFEGHDTTASSLNWTLHLIGANPDVQTKVHEEVDAIFGTDDREATMDDVKELKYLECCIKEALRLLPTIPMFSRSIKEDVKLGDYTIPKGSQINVMTTALHNDPTVFPDPEVYIPDRFFPENTQNRHPYSYIPFSAGPRNCIGQRFALLEEKTVLSKIFRNFSVKSCQSRDELRPIGEMVLRPEKGIIVELKPRL